MRYIVASLVSPALASDLRQSYFQAFSKTCKVRTLHLTFIPPFTIDCPNTLFKIQETINQLPDTNHSFFFGQPGIFTVRDNRQVLYLPLKPAAPLQAIHQYITDNLSSLIQIETKNFKSDEIPEFLPHITLDYHFNQPDLNSYIPPADPFNLEMPRLLEERAPGIWQPTD